VLTDISSHFQATSDAHILLGAGICTLLGIEADDGGTPWMPHWEK